MSSVQRLPIIPRIIFDLQSDSSDEDFWKKVYFCNIIMFHTKLLCNSMYPLKTFNFSLYHICRTLQTQPHVISTCLDDSKSHWEEELSGPIKKKKRTAGCAGVVAHATKRFLFSTGFQALYRSCASYRHSHHCNNTLPTPSAHAPIPVVRFVWVRYVPMAS